MAVLRVLGRVLVLYAIVRTSSLRGAEFDKFGINTLNRPIAASRNASLSCLAFNCFDSEERRSAISCCAR